MAALTAACAKESINEKDKPLPEGEESTLSITLNVPGPETKTSLGAKNGSTYPVYWSADDVITLNGTAATSFSPAIGNASATATFKVSNLSAPYNFLYGGVSGQGNQVNFPSTQNYVAGGFDPAAMPMYASVTDLKSGVTFSHVGALLKFSLTGSKKIDSVTLTPVDGSKSLSGNFTIGANDSGILNGTLTPASTGTSLIYSFNGHKQLSDEPFVFYIAIPAGTYEGGITLDIVDNASGHMTVTVLDSNSSKTIAAGVVREFENVVYSPNKETNLIQIYDTATLQNFVTRVNNGEYTLNARLTQNASSLNVSSIAASWTPIEGYKGIFDGNGKTISGLTKPMFGTLQGVVKNLTLNSTVVTNSADELSWGIFAKEIVPSSAIDDIAGLQNCTAKGSITWTPGSALGGASQLGGLVGNNKGGTISGCANEATVTFADNGVENDSQPSVGGVVGRTQKGGELKSQGYITNCSNSGTVVCAAQFNQNIYIGGVLGYQVEKAENLSGCTNSGLVKVTSTASTGAALHIGGVIGLGKGTIESCSNASEGVVTTEECTVDTYLCQGGVVGRLNDDSGRVYETLTNAGTLNVAALGGSSGRYIGGVAGRCNEGGVLSGVTNSGNINYTSVDEKQTYIGGVVALNNKSGISLANCSSTGGTLTYSGTTEHGPLYIGGVVGYSTQPVTSCTSAMTIEVGGAFEPTSNQYFCVGGIVGKMTGNDISNCLNTGNITYSQEISGSNGYTFVGGVVGQIKGSISDSSNGGTVTITGKNTAQNPFYGGVVGSTDSASAHSITGKYSTASATNYGSVIINSTQSAKYVYVGGVAGRMHTDGTLTATNNGPINITMLSCSRAYIGGLTGLTNGATSLINSGSANLAGGDITVSGLTVTSDYLYCGGVVGFNSATVTSATNAGDVVLTDGSSCYKSMFVGGVVGRGEANITGCTNSGIVSNACQVKYKNSYLQVGGVVGYNNGSSVVSNCHNTGNVTNSANCNGYLYVGGITSEADAAVSNCDNTGNVTNSGNSAQSKWISVGGVVGFASAAITSCSNGTASEAGGTISNSGTSNEDVNIGGIAGNNNGVSFTSCYNKGAVENSGDSKSGYNVNIGGLVGWSSANSTYSSTCYNTGAITNTGVGSNTSPVGVRLGGLIGTASGTNTLTGTSSVYNYNSGNILENSESANVSVGGIVGYAYNDASNFTYSKNEGVVKFSNTHTKIYVGGIAGVFGNSSVIDNTYNDSDIEAEEAVMQHAGSLKLGGIIGGWIGEAGVAQTITGCTNTGWITLRSDHFGKTGSGTMVDSFVGGIAGGGPDDNDICSKTLYGCKNSGKIRMGDTGSANSGKLYHRFCVGGIIGWVDVNPTNSKCIADVRFRTTSGTNRIGGIAGEMTIDNIHDITYKGTVNSNGTSGTNYTGGLVGNVGTGEITFDNCTASGAMHGPNSATTPAGIFCSNIGGGTGPTINLTNCKIGYNTGPQTASSGYWFRITQASDITASNVFGSNGSSHSCTEGTNSGNSVVDPETITL